MAAKKKEGYREIIDRLKNDHPDIKELCLISNGTILVRKIDISAEEEFYVYNIENLINQGVFNLEKIYEGKEGIKPNRIIIRLNELSMIIQTIKGKNFLVVIYDNRNKDFDRQVVNLIGLEINNLKPTLAY